MIFYPPKDAEIQLWMLYSTDGNGTFIEGVFTNKTQAEAAMRALKEDSPIARYNIVERTTWPHET